jgi:hypothetical protein
MFRIMKVIFNPNIGWAIVWTVVIVGGFLMCLNIPPDYKTRKDHMNQLDRIEKKIDQLIQE